MRVRNLLKSGLTNRMSETQPLIGKRTTHRRSRGRERNSFTLSFWLQSHLQYLTGIWKPPVAAAPNASPPVAAGLVDVIAADRADHGLKGQLGLDGNEKVTARIPKQIRGCIQII